MTRGDRRKCKCCLKLFRPDPRNRRHQRYCSARPLAKLVGWANPRTRITSAALCTSRGSEPGDCAIPAIESLRTAGDSIPEVCFGDRDVVQFRAIKKRG
jgi:hypothetical protein